MITRYVGVGVGAWYLLAPFLWGYPLGFLWWHDAAIGAVVLALSASYLVSWNRVGGWLLMLTGVYSMLSPFLHGYITEQFAYWNDLVFGVITVGCGAMLAGAGMVYGDAGARAPDG